MTTALLALAGTVAAVVVLGAVLRARSGRVRTGSVERVDAGLEPFDGVTLLQLSTTFCASCRQARAVLGEVADREPGLRHVEVDLTERPELAARLRVHEAPTTLALDPAGRELFRVAGVPRPARLLDALRPHLDRQANA